MGFKKFKPRLLTFLRENNIFSSQKKPIITNIDEQIHHLFIDYPLLQYKCTHSFYKELIGHDITSEEFEEFTFFYEEIKHSILSGNNETDYKLGINLFKIFKFLQKMIININNKKQLKSVRIMYEGHQPLFKLHQQRYDAYINHFKNKTREEFNSYCAQKGLTFEYPDELTKKLFDEETDFDGSLYHDDTFILNLERYVCDYLRRSFFGVDIIFSSEEDNGEAEFKIFRDIKFIPENDTICIYSADSDVIISSLLNEKNRMFVMDLMTNINLKVGEVYLDSYFYYWDITILGDIIYEKIFEEVRYNVVRDLIISKINVLRDFCFMNFFYGNDYLPTLHLFNDKNFNNLFFCYKKVFIEQNIMFNTGNFCNNLVFHMNGKTQVNYFFLRSIFEKLSYKKGKNIQKQNFENTILEVSMIERLFHQTIFNPFLNGDISIFGEWEKLHSFSFPNQFSQINYESTNWKEQYNNIYFPGKNINTICDKYLGILMAMVKYYYDIDDNFSVSYYHHMSPLPKDIYEYMRSDIFRDHRWIRGTKMLNFSLGIKEHFTWGEKYLLTHYNTDYPRESTYFPKKFLEILNEKVKNDINFSLYYPKFQNVDWLIGNITNLDHIFPNFQETNLTLIRKFIKIIKQELNEEDSKIIDEIYY